VFNQWAHIDGWEGDFLERIAPGAFSRTLAEDRASIKVLFQHGADAATGSKPLGPITTLREDDVGLAYEVPLLDTSYNRDLLPGLKAGVYGASFRFQAILESWDERPAASSYNPRALPERTLRDVALKELGPVTFGAYGGATAGMRTLPLTPSTTVTTASTGAAFVTLTEAV
jgi:HK97 family phage prohead protease